ncbi:hypothetical protein [Streptomyces sp. NPDC091649]|uniref:SbtR family transcriptional regulator n=1 Tax=Streptomyces sp. NPDC091649 TaxID=3366004 RepID=UPI00380F0231
MGHGLCRRVALSQQEGAPAAFGPLGRHGPGHLDRDAAARIIERARLAGAVRPDFTGEDLLLFFGANALLARAGAGTAPDAWRRQVAFLLDGLRAGPGQRPLSVGPLTPQQVYDVMGRLAGAP